MEWDGMVIIGQWSSKRTFGANNQDVCILVKLQLYRRQKCDRNAGIVSTHQCSGLVAGKVRRQDADKMHM